MASTRRLTAILAADVAGYSRLMGADEEGTHERVKVHLRELVDPKIREHRGRTVKNTGDGFLAEFLAMKQERDAVINGTGRGLVVLKASVVDAELEKLDLKLRTVRRATRMVSPTAYEVGETAGACWQSILELAGLELNR